MRHVTTHNNHLALLLSIAAVIYLQQVLAKPCNVTINPREMPPTSLNVSYLSRRPLVNPKAISPVSYFFFFADMKPSRVFRI
jgi:hypothetical protein